MLNGKLKICWNIILFQFNPSPYLCYIMFAYLLFIIHAHIEQRIFIFLNFPHLLTTIKLWSLPLPHGFNVNSAIAICLFVTSSGLICYNISSWSDANNIDGFIVHHYDHPAKMVTVVPDIYIYIYKSVIKNKA